MPCLVKCLILTILIAGCAAGQVQTEKDKFIFDHAYTKIENEDDFFSLGKRGFFLKKGSVTHPGPVVCRFIKFTPSDYPSWQYLEWCHTEDFKKMAEKMKAKGEPEVTPMGIGHRTVGDVQKLFSGMKGQFDGYSLFSKHKNFDWQKNDKDILPGWDYVTTKKPLLPGITVFGVKYGDPGAKIVKTAPKVHVNSAYKIIGLIADLDSTQLGRLARFSGDLAVKSVISNGHGFHIMSTSALKDHTKIWSRKKNKLRAVVLRIRSEAEFKKYAKPDYHFTFLGEKFYGIKASDQSWDILATESDLKKLNRVSADGHTVSSMNKKKSGL